MPEPFLHVHRIRACGQPRRDSAVPPVVTVERVRDAAAFAAVSNAVRADVGVADHQSVGLTLGPDNSPPRHVYIKGWPANDVDELDKRRALVKLAARPLLHPLVSLVSVCIIQHPRLVLMPDELEPRAMAIAEDVYVSDQAN